MRAALEYCARESLIGGSWYLRHCQVLLVDESNAARVVTLNRPKVLNCINLPMVGGLACKLCSTWI